MTFEELLAQLPTCPGSAALPISNKTGGLNYVAGGLPEFIGPDLSASVVFDQPAKPKVIIISAAGAVGKSASSTFVMGNQP